MVAGIDAVRLPTTVTSLHFSFDVPESANSRLCAPCVFIVLQSWKVEISVNLIIYSESNLSVCVCRISVIIFAVFVVSYYLQQLVHCVWKPLDIGQINWFDQAHWIICTHVCVVWVYVRITESDTQWQNYIKTWIFLKPPSWHHHQHITFAPDTSY